MSKVDIHLASIRKARGIGAAELARRVGVSRQTVYAIEAGAYVPNTEVALRIGRELGVGVEELFSLSGGPAARTPSLRADYLGRGPARKGQAVRAARVGGHWIGVPADARPYYLPEADGVVQAGSGRPRLGLFAEEASMTHRVVLAGCDPAASLLARMVEKDRGVEIVHAPASSRHALGWLKSGKVHIAGSHLLDPKTAEFNMPAVRRQFPSQDMFVITFAGWEEGLVVASGNPRGIRAIEDLSCPGVRLMNRETGSGSRRLLDRGLRDLGLRASAVRGYRREAPGHLAAAHAVLIGEADCCVATRSAARAFGLDFVPLQSERYDFVLRRETLDLAPVAALLDVLQRAALRQKLSSLAGYDTSETGVVRA